MITQATTLFNRSGPVGRALSHGFALLLLSAFSVSVFAQDANKNLLESINTAALQSGKVVVRINFKEPLKAEPASFSVTNPARIALDLPNIANGLGKNAVDIGEGDVRSVSVVEVANRTRMVFNLTRPMTYTTKLEGKSLLVTIDAAPQGVVKDVALVKIGRAHV